ncbi:MAG: BlaI/MecI/CopY family transcriptional regulator [Lachnospiraceae bacterium]|nr:BlaI/MecI/CopY family transcriptional regulator [Lachnospiraceae bacterium]
MELTKGELSVLEILIEAEEPLSKAGILDNAPENRNWKNSSIHILLNSLLKKEAICEVGFVRIGKGYGRTFAPTDSGRAYYKDLLTRLSQKVSSYDLVSQLIKEGTFTPEELDQLEKLIQSKR